MYREVVGIQGQVTGTRDSLIEQIPSVGITLPSLHLLNSVYHGALTTAHSFEMIVLFFLVCTDNFQIMGCTAHCETVKINCVLSPK